jgi:hypothetical protein
MLLISEYLQCAFGKCHANGVAHFQTGVGVASVLSANNERRGIAHINIIVGIGAEIDDVGERPL